MNYENDFRYNFDFSFSSNNDDHVNVSFKAVGVNQIVTKFQDFLTGCGFVLDGDLQIVSRDAQYQKAHLGSFGSMPTPTSGGITKEQIAALQPIGLQAIKPLKNEDILHFGV